MDTETIKVTMRVDGSGLDSVKIRAIDNVPHVTLVLAMFLSLVALGCFIYANVAGERWPIAFGFTMIALVSHLDARAWREAARRFAVVAMMQEAKYEQVAHRLVTSERERAELEVLLAKRAN